MQQLTLKARFLFSKNKQLFFNSSRLFTQKIPKNEEREFSPFSVKLDKDKQIPQQPSTLQKLMTFFSERITSTSNTKEEEQKTQQQTQPKQVSQEEKIKQVIDLIESNINRKYFSEKKLEDFFDLCFSIKDKVALFNQKRFQQFIQHDFKLVLQSLRMTDNIIGFTKFVVYFKIDHDPEIYDILADQIAKNMNRFTVDEILTALVNFTYTLSPETASLFQAANDEFIQRLDSNFNAMSRDLYIQYEDFLKILNTLLDHKQMAHELKDQIFTYVKDNIYQFNYSILSEIAVIYASKMDKTFKEMFFREFKDKFFKDLRYLDQNTFYKIVWALVKSNMIQVNDQTPEWQIIKEAIQSKIKEFDPKTLTNILILSTAGKDKKSQELQGDLFDTLESELILKMKQMQLHDLINLLWSAQEIKKGSDYFYQKLEQEITVKIKEIKDDDLQLLIGCFSEQQSHFSQKFMDIIIRVIEDKKDRFQLKTLVYIIWSFAKIDFNSVKVTNILQSFAKYERLVNNLGNLQQTSLCILLWTYSRNENLCDQEFLLKVSNAIINFNGQIFELDNFDLLLIVQSIMHLERSPLKDNTEFMKRIYQLASIAETFVIKNVEKMNINEFITISIFYLSQLDQTSQILRDQITKIVQQNVEQFNEMQLIMLQQALIKLGQHLIQKGEDVRLIENALDSLDNELEGIKQEKELLASENKIRELIREQIQVKMKLQTQLDINEGGLQQDERLEKEIPKSQSVQQKQQYQEEEKGKEEELHFINEIKKDRKQQEIPKTEIKEEEKLKKYLINRKRK